MYAEQKKLQTGNVLTKSAAGRSKNEKAYAEGTMPLNGRLFLCQKQGSEYKKMTNTTMQSIYTWLVSLYTASELKLMALGSLTGAFFSVAVGGMDQQITNLVYLVITDYTTGMIAAWKTKTLGSARGFRGLFKKVAIFAAIGFLNVVDNAMGIHTLRAMAIFGFAGLEAMSIIENVDRMGYGEYIPGFIREKLAQIREEKGIKLT